MKREDIAKIFEGATDEQISAVLDINSADIGKVKGKLESERDTYKSQLETATAQLKGFEGVNVEELNANKKSAINSSNQSIAVDGISAPEPKAPSEPSRPSRTCMSTA